MDSKEEVDKFKMQLFHVKTHKKRRSHIAIGSSQLFICKYIYKAALLKQGATANANHWYFLKAPHYISSSLGAPVHCVRCLQILNSLRLYFLLTSAAHCDYVCTWIVRNLVNKWGVKDHRTWWIRLLISLEWSRGMNLADGQI